MAELARSGGQAGMPPKCTPKVHDTPCFPSVFPPERAAMAPVGALHFSDAASVPGRHQFRYLLYTSDGPDARLRAARSRSATLESRLRPTSHTTSRPTVTPTISMTTSRAEPVRDGSDVWCNSSIAAASVPKGITTAAILHNVPRPLPRAYPGNTVRSA